MRKNFLLIITLALMCWGLFGTWAQGGRGPNIGFLKSPWITGPSGVYTKYTNQEGGVRWSPSKSDPTVAIHSEASGFGDVTSTLTNITIAGKPFSVSGSGTSIGSMQVVFGWPFSAAATWAYSSHGKSIAFIETPGTYRWSASGNVKLTPYVWEWDLGSGPNLTGDWVKKPELADTEGALAASGKWRVEHKAECIACKVIADSVADLSPDHDKVLCTAPGCNETYRKCKPGKHTSKPCPISITRDGGLVYCSIPAWECQPHNTHHFPGSPSNGGSNPPSSGGSSSGCSNASGADYCDDTGTCSTKSEKGVAGTCGHNWCCCADYDNSGSSNTGSSNTGSSSGGSSSGDSSSSRTLCPANRWTSCGSTTSHAATCGAGHTYYTCNPLALARHETSQTCTRSGCGASYTRCTKNDGSCSGGRYIWHR